MRLHIFLLWILTLIFTCIIRVPDSRAAWVYMQGGTAYSKAKSSLSSVKSSSFAAAFRYEAFDVGPVGVVFAGGGGLYGGGGSMSINVYRRVFGRNPDGLYLGLGIGGDTFKWKGRIFYENDTQIISPDYDFNQEFKIQGFIACARVNLFENRLAFGYERYIGSSGEWRYEIPPNLLGFPFNLIGGSLVSSIDIDDMTADRAFVQFFYYTPKKKNRKSRVFYGLTLQYARLKIPYTVDYTSANLFTQVKTVVPETTVDNFILFLNAGLMF